MAKKRDMEFWEKTLEEEEILYYINMTKQQNVLKQTYISGGDPPVKEVYQLGMLPLFVYRIDF